MLGTVLCGVGQMKWHSVDLEFMFSRRFHNGQKFSEILSSNFFYAARESHILMKLSAIVLSQSLL